MQCVSNFKVKSLKSASPIKASKTLTIRKHKYLKFQNIILSHKYHHDLTFEKSGVNRQNIWFPSFNLTFKLILCLQFMLKMIESVDTALTKLQHQKDQLPFIIAQIQKLTFSGAT